MYARALLRFSRGLSSEALDVLESEATPLAILKSLIATEACQKRKSYLLALKYAITGLEQSQDAYKASQDAFKASQDAYKASQDAYKASQDAFEKVYKVSQDAYKARQDAFQMAEETVEALQVRIVALELDLMRVRGLNNTRGLFEYLQEKIYKKHPATSGMKGSAKLWNQVIAMDKTLELCMRQYIRTGDLGVHTATAYQILSQHIHAGKELSMIKATIIFDAHHLTPEHANLMVCLGQAAGVPVAPGPRTTC